MRELQARFTVSERRACQVLDQPRSSQRYACCPRNDEVALVQRMLGLAAKRPRYGYRRIAALLRRESWRASASRVLRLWRREGLKEPQKRRIRRAVGHGAQACHVARATAKNEVWCWDFVFDRRCDGSSLKGVPGLEGWSRPLRRRRDRYAASPYLHNPWHKSIAVPAANVVSGDAPIMQCRAHECRIATSGGQGMEILFVANSAAGDDLEFGKLA